MSKNLPTLNDYLKRGYAPILLQHGNNFCFYIPELGLIGEGTSVESAFKAIEEKKKAHFEKIISLGLHSHVALPETKSAFHRKDYGLKSIFIKSAAFAVALALFTLLLFPVITSYIKHELKSLSPIQAGTLMDTAIQASQSINLKLKTAPAEKKAALKKELNELHQTFCQTFEGTSLSESICGRKKQ